MHLKENNFSGFKAYYKDGSIVSEYSVSLNSNKTNWSTVDNSQVILLEIYWKGILKASIKKDEYNILEFESWVYFHTGFKDIGCKDTKVISRNIGITIKGVSTIYSVNEDSGELNIYTRLSR